MKITKPKILARKTLASPPIAWRQPFDDQRSLFRISFSDNDPTRGDTKFIRVRKIDGSLAEYIVKKAMAAALANSPSPQMIAECPEHLECCQCMSDEVTAYLKNAAETTVDGILHIDANPINRAPTDDPTAHTSISLRPLYALTHALLLWLSRNPAVTGPTALGVALEAVHPDEYNRPSDAEVEAFDHIFRPGPLGSKMAPDSIWCAESRSSVDDQRPRLEPDQ